MKHTVLIVVALGVVALSVGEWVAHRRVERQYRAAIDTRRSLELELGELRAEREQLSSELSDEQTRVTQLAQQLSTKDAELEAVVERLAQEERIILELQGRLLAMQHQFDRLQGELAMTLEKRVAKRSPETGEAVQLERVVVTQPASSASELQGRVVSFNPEWRFVIIDLGWNLVNIGDIVSIYRDDQLLGKARVERVQEEISAASLLPDSLETDIQANDIVRVF